MRFSRYVRLLALAAMAFACQPLPHPFQPDAARKSTNPLIHLRDGYGVFVLPATGMTGPAAEALADEMAAALVRRDLPAFTDSDNPGSYRLAGESVTTDRGDSEADIRLTWTLRTAEGAAVGEHGVTVTAPRADWRAGSPELMRSIAAGSADAIAAMVLGPAPVDRTLSEKARMLYVWPIDGAPKAAGGLLREELEAALLARNLRIGSGLTENAVVVTGVVSVTPGNGENRKLSLEWTVLRPDGGELGKLTQENPVSAERLEQDWPEIARAIAAGAAGGIHDILNRVPDEALD